MKFVYPDYSEFVRALKRAKKPKVIRDISNNDFWYLSQKCFWIFHTVDQRYIERLMDFIFKNKIEYKIKDEQNDKC